MKIEPSDFEYGVGVHFLITAQTETERILLMSAVSPHALKKGQAGLCDEDESNKFTLILPVSNE